ncbi:MAG: hypothetical protein KGH72_03860 [Candidatus Micrarchaeota archaeon]|nr:hypothetical protein [Candidatus Micrarchaeota archaeon]
MDLFEAYRKLLLSSMGTKRVYLNSGARWNASVRQLHDISLEVGEGEATFVQYSDIRRYIIAKKISFDLFLSVFDVNTRKAIVMRTLQPLNKRDRGAMLPRYLSKFANPNIEIRAIGLQNGQSVLAENLDSIMSMGQMKAFKKKGVAEIDLFGEEIRHIVFDLKTGATYNLLLENRIYRPGELINSSIKREDIQFSELKYI